MGIFKRIFRLKKQPFVLKYDQSLNQWEIINETGIIYMGSRKNCETYLKYSSYNN